jgi:hypothetical protein
VPSTYLLVGDSTMAIIYVLYTLKRGNLPYTLVKGTVYIHPTLAEGLWFLASRYRQ